mmetsp:Transcript_37305/g.93683  ORF Transcript_37305/g.93683 Transcript_37305/m.93683 type:complete len:348 (+) Transcript_37305:119-1162(+)
MPGRPLVAGVSFLLSLFVVEAGVGSGGQVAVRETGTGANVVPQVRDVWRGSQVNDLFREYNNIFRHGNRNAASHLWVRFLLERSEQMTHKRLVHLFAGFCAVSGSPVRPSDYNRYKLTLDRVDGSGKVAGFMHYCCWPCVCDTQDFIRVDTRRVVTSDGERTYNFAVIGNPCDHEEELTRPFQDSFHRGMSTLQRLAPEVRCKDGVLQGAPLSDNGFVIIAMFFDAPAALNPPPRAAVARHGSVSQPGRMTEVGGVKFQDEIEYEDQCEDRKRNGYNSGMGEIFRRVAAISPVQIAAPLSQQKLASSEENASECHGSSGSTTACGISAEAGAKAAKVAKVGVRAEEL